MEHSLGDTFPGYETFRPRSPTQARWSRDIRAAGLSRCPCWGRLWQRHVSGLRDELLRQWWRLWSRELSRGVCRHWRKLHLL